jgi:triacylglycerol lipase
MKSNLILNQPGFVLANARLLASYSQRVYSLGTEDDFKTGGLCEIHGVETDTQCHIWNLDDCTVIAFRGTSSLRDWITDAEFPLRPMTGSNGRVHEGFLNALNNILAMMIARLLPDGVDKARLKPIVITGHSLGGSLAALCAYCLNDLGLPIHSVYTFGQPRTGDAKFAQAYNAELGDRTFRLVNQNDIVPRVPGWLLGYRHHSQNAFVTIAGGLALNPSLLTIAVTDALGLYRAYRKFDDVVIEDHFMAGYIAALNSPNIAP